MVSPDGRLYTAGWYSYDFIDNARKGSAKCVLPELQQLKVGDIMPTSPNGSGFEVIAIDPEKSLVLAICDSKTTISSAIVLSSVDNQKVRLIMRLRARFNLPLFAFYLIFEPGDFIMMRKQMLGIKERAERLFEKEIK